MEGVDGIVSGAWPIVMMNPREITPYHNNPRRNDAAVDKVAESIRAFGFRQNPIVVDRDMVIICGHTRREAALRLGMDSVPVMVADFTPEQARAYRIADNRTAEFSTWEPDKLGIEFGVIGADSPEALATGFGEDEIARLLAGSDEDAEPAEDAGAANPPEEPRSEKGFVYELGRHRLLCGDSTEGADVAALFDGDGEEPVELLLTDPPYNVAYAGRCGSTTSAQKYMYNEDLTIENDSMGEAEYAEFMRGWLVNAEAFMRKGASAYVFYADAMVVPVYSAMAGAGLKPRQTLIWAKTHLVLSRSQYFNKHEPVAYAWKGGAAHRWHGARDDSTTTVITMQSETRCDAHPNMKPVALFEYFIRNSSAKGEIVFDPFCGSGTCVVACERNGRVCRAVETEPKYCDVIRRRWAETMYGEGCDWEARTPGRRAL